jgi:Asp-tRNA(Asn)/Glu-tRNA(Gln) amidotransferase A subunit family amidase
MRLAVTAAEAAAAIRTGALSSVELVGSCLERISALEPSIGAWAFLDPEHALAQAEAADRRRAAGDRLGPLHGVPVGIKDIFDTADMPTENGTVLHAGRTPVEDAAAVALLRRAGAVVMGKTVTTELAVYAPGKTRNPVAPEHTPGGSSSGSAAAVAAGMVPLAVGSQTNGSVIRPASYCGVVGYKPTRGLVSLYGGLSQSRRLDTIGVFATTVEDAALIADVLMAFDGRDPEQLMRARPTLAQTAAADAPVEPRLAFVRTPLWDRQDADAANVLLEFVGRFRGVITEVFLPDWTADGLDWHRTILEADLARSFAAEYERGRDLLSPELCRMIERGQTHRAVDYNRAVDGAARLRDAIGEALRSRDAILTPGTTGTAPLGLESTGSPMFCTLWTLAGLPAVSLPLLTGENSLPLGIQLVGRRGDDARLLRTARWLSELAVSASSARQTA